MEAAARRRQKIPLRQPLQLARAWKNCTPTPTQVVQDLFAALMADPALLPADHQAQIPTQGLARTVADYIAGMTDSYIEQLWARCGSR